MRNIAMDWNSIAVLAATQTSDFLQVKTPATTTLTLFFATAITAARPAPHPRAGDVLSPGEFLSPPIDARPGAFWSWLNGST
jgi:hypothetical protein